ncbi:MAG: type II/IV secretion system ATPase subunit [Candidatus Woesearchaeota archaeon]
MPEDYEVIHEGAENILRINYEAIPRIPSIEDDPVCMANTIEKLIEVPNATKIVFYQKRDYEYDFDQVAILREIAALYNQLMKQKEIFSYEALKFGIFTKDLNTRYNDMQRILQLLKTDPLGAYVELKRLFRLEKIKLDNYIEDSDIAGQQKYLSLIKYLIDLLDKTRIVNLARPYLSGYSLGNRGVYAKIFRPIIKPDFMYTKLMASYPVEGEEIGSYDIENTEVTIFRIPDTVHLLYHIIPPEFKLSEDNYDILDTARRIMAEHKPEKEEFTDPERMRQVFFNVGRDLIEELANYKNVKLTETQLNELASILVRYTIGFGLIEVLLKDEKIQDITINSPPSKSPIFIVHSDFDNCKTNIITTRTEAESWATKLRLLSGRPLDEANPILDTEISIPGARARVAAISSPLNPSGLAFAFRRHRDKPWTLPLFIKNGMLDPLAAGLISFLIDGNRTILVAGTRSAGKTSLLASLMVELMRTARIITIEDTLELPVGPLIELGYNIQQMKVASALTKGTAEVPADEGIRTTLRLGDSALFVGEVRSTEARALYEAMRIGALANVVAGTIHGDSPYGVYDRVVNDLQVPKTSFKATDIIIVANPIRSADGLHRWRRITQITEVRKHWEQDPLLEHGFCDLMKYDAKQDKLIPTDELVHGESDVLKNIAGNVKEWAGSWDAVWDNIQLRANIKKALVEASIKLNKPELLEADFVISANDQFHKISDKVKEEVGTIDSKRIFFEWSEWLKNAVKKRTNE